MEIKNLLTPQARASFESVSQGIKRKVKPLTDIGSDFVTQNVEAIKPAVQNVSETVNTSFVEPIKQPFQQAKQRTEAIGQINTFFSEKGINADDIKALAEEEGLDFNEVLTKFQNNGIKVEGMEKMTTQEAAPNEKLGVMGSIGQGIYGAGRVGEQIPRYAGNLLNLTQEYVTTPLIAGGLEALGAEEAGQAWRSAGKRFGQGAQQLGEEITRAGEGNISEEKRQARRFGASIAATAPIPLGNIPKVIQGAKLLPTIARGAYYGAVGTPIYTGIEEGRLPTGNEMIAGTAGGAVLGPLVEKVAIPGIIKGAEKVGKYGQALVKGGTEGLKKSVSRDIQALKQGPTELVTRNIPKAVVRRDLGFTPTERAKIEKITGTDEAQYILGKGLAGKGKEELAEVFMRQSDDMYNGITSQLSKVDAKVQSPVAKEALMDILDQLESSPKLARAYAKDIEGVKQMLARDEFTLSELNNIRRAYDKVNTGMFTAQGKVRSGLENAVDTKVRQDLSSQLQKEAKKYGVDVKEMNKELRVGLEMKDALLRRLSQEERNNFIGLQDLGVSAILSGGEPISAIATIAAKKYGEKVAPGLAQKAYNLNKTPNVTRRVNRGNTITPRNKSNGLGLSVTNKPDMVRVPVKELSSEVTPKGVPKKTEVTSKPNATIKPKVSDTNTSDTIPEGYFKNAFGEIVKKPNWKKRGFIKIRGEDKGIVKRSADIDSTTHDKFISHLNKKEWWRTAENINANNTRGRFLASSFKEAEFYGRPLDTPFKVNIKKPLIGSEEYIMGKLGMKKPSDNIFLQERFKLDEQMAQKALSQGYDSIALLSEKGFNDLKAGKIPRSIELNDLTTVNKPIVNRASDSNAVNVQIKKPLKVDSSFDLSEYFRKKQFEGGTRKDYLERKYKGISKATGLDSLGISDDSIEWIDKWSSADMSTPSIKVISELGRFKPNKPQDIYWGGSVNDFSLSRNKPQSFTTDLKVAQEFGSAGRRDNPVIIKVSSINPDDVAINLGTVPESMKKILRIYDESEVITKSNMNLLSKKYIISESKDGGKTWTVLNKNIIEQATKPKSINGDEALMSEAEGQKLFREKYKGLDNTKLEERVVKRASDVEGVYNPKDKSIYIGENNFKAKPFQGFSYTSLESVIDSDIFKKIPELKSFKIEPSNKFGIDFKNEILYFPGTDKKLFKKANYQEYLSPDGLKEFGKFLNSISKDDFMDVVKKESNVFASKMKTAFENSKKIAEKEATVIAKNPIKVYRGEGGSSIGNTTYVKGRYFADSKEFASTFGNVTESEIPAGTKIFDFSKINGNPEQKIIPPEILVDNDKLTAYIIDMGYDATMNKNSRGIEYVLLNKELNKVMKMKRNKEIIDPFKINFESVKDFWDNLDYLQKKSNYMIPDKIY